MVFRVVSVFSGFSSRPRSGQMLLAVGGALRGAHGRRANHDKVAASAASERVGKIGWKLGS